MVPLNWPSDIDVVEDREDLLAEPDGGVSDFPSLT